MTSIDSLPDTRKALIAGATGLVGGHLLAALRVHRGYAQPATLGRRACDNGADTVHFSLDDDSITAAMDCDVVFCSLGTTIRQAGSQAAFRSVDFDLILKIARSAELAGVSTFILVSSLGADAASANFYLRTKGELEHALTELGMQRLGIIRPSLLLGARSALRPAEAIGQMAARFINPLMIGPLSTYRAVEATAVATAMIALDQSDFNGTTIVESNQIA